MGQGGIQTDDAQNLIPPTNYIELRDVNQVNGVLEKHPGSKRFNGNIVAGTPYYFPFPGSVVSIEDWWPTEAKQYLAAFIAGNYFNRGTVALTNGSVNGTFEFAPTVSLAGLPITLTDLSPSPVLTIDTHVAGATAFTLSASYTGATTTATGFYVTINNESQNIYLQTSGFDLPQLVDVDPLDFTSQKVLASSGSQVKFVTGGRESATKNRKLFCFTGSNPVQVIDGDSGVRRNISKPDGDWSGTNQPTFGVMFRGRLFALGNIGNPHVVYVSRATDHEDFSTSDVTPKSVFPGESERLITAWVYKGRFFVGKYPQGIYYLVDSDSNANNWYFTKLGTNFGVASPNSAVEVLDDMLIANVTGSITSSNAAFQLGDIKSADLLNILRSERYMRENTNQDSFRDRWGIYYEDKKQVYFTYRSPTGTTNDRLLVIDMSKQKPYVSWSFKDQPNCLALLKDLYGVYRPAYGANDGYVYLMDSADRVVGVSTGYKAVAQTPYTDLGSTIEKSFDFLELTFEPTGKWNVEAKVFIDGKYSQTVNFNVYYGDLLDRFILDKSKLAARVPRSVRVPISGKGRSISVELSNSSAFQNFRIQSLTVYFRGASQAQKDPNK
jgi:hypothetical protein